MIFYDEKEEQTYNNYIEDQRRHEEKQRNARRLKIFHRKPGYELVVRRWIKRLDSFYAGR